MAQVLKDLLKDFACLQVPPTVCIIDEEVPWPWEDLYYVYDYHEEILLN